MINEEVLEKYYGQIANKLNEMIPVKWTKIAMLAEDLGTSCAAWVYFVSKDDKVYYNHNIPEDFNVSEDVYDELLHELWGINRGLREAFIKASIEPWEVMIFILNEDWSFQVKYEYNINKEVDNFEREIIWAYEELGIYPEDEFEKEKNK